MTCEDSQDVIFSLESTAGSSPCSSPGGKGRAGPAPARASRSASPARAPGKRTPDTCGPLFTASSPSADLQQCLANRLVALTDCNGSPEYALTWRDLDMPWGPPICRLRALARRTNDNGYGGWPTPRTADGDKNVRTEAGAAKEAQRKGPMNDLSTATHMAGWVSPTAQDGERGSAPPRAHDTGVSLSQQVAGWPTPMSRDGEHGGRRVNDGKRGAGLKEALTGWATPRVTTNGGHGNPERAADGKARLEDQVQGWATPSARDWRSEAGPGHDARMAETRGQPLSRQTATTGGRGALAPEFSRWLMGCPRSWLISAPHSVDWLRWQVLMAPLSAARKRIALLLYGVAATPSSRR